MPPPQAPVSIAKYIIPALYLGYVAASHYGAPAFSELLTVKEEVTIVEQEKSETNGDVVTAVAVSETTTVATVVQPPTVCPYFSSELVSAHF